MKAVLISIQPKWVAKIASGEKTIEVRKTKPKLETPFKCYIYATKSGDRTVLINDRVFDVSKSLTGKVIGEFVCDRIDEYKYRLTTYEETPYKGKYISKEELAKTCLSIGEINDYLNGKNGYFWHITDLKIYDKPKELSEFKTVKVINRYHKKEYDKFDKLSHSHRVQVTYHERPPQSWCYVEEL